MVHMADIPPLTERMKMGDLIKKFWWRPLRVLNCEQWMEFLDKFSNKPVEMNMGWNWIVLFIEGSNKPFVAICGLRGIGIYYDAIVLG